MQLSRRWDVDRVHNPNNDGLASNRYEVHISFTCAVKLYARIMTHPEKSERDLQLCSMLSVLQFLVVPKICQHVMLEQYFEDTKTTRLFVPCDDGCNKCRRYSLTGQINRHRLTRLLVGCCSKGNSTTTGGLVKFIKDNQRIIFHSINDQPKKGMGNGAYSRYLSATRCHRNSEVWSRRRKHKKYWKERIEHN
jgi:hypothetical protein